MPAIEASRVVADELRFKAKLAIGEQADASLRAVNRAREIWDVLGAAAPQVHPVFFAHRVEGLAPGAYVLPRSAEGLALLCAALQARMLEVARKRLQRDQEQWSRLERQSLGDFLSQGLENAGNVLVLDLERHLRAGVPRLREDDVDGERGALTRP